MVTTTSKLLSENCGDNNETNVEKTMLHIVYDCQTAVDILGLTF